MRFSLSPIVSVSGARISGTCITQLKAQGPSRTCHEGKGEEEEVSGAGMRVQDSSFQATAFGFQVSGLGIFLSPIVSVSGAGTRTTAEQKCGAVPRRAHI